MLLPASAIRIHPDRFAGIVPGAVVGTERFGSAAMQHDALLDVRRPLPYRAIRFAERVGSAKRTASKGRAVSTIERLRSAVQFRKGQECLR